MPTRAFILRKTMKGYEGVLCYFEGDPQNIGPILLECYNRNRKVSKLLSLGDILALGPFLGERHDVWERPHGVTSFYGRDGGDLFCGPQKFASIDELHEWLHSTLMEYIYVFDGQWLFAERKPYADGQTQQEWTELKPLMSLFPLATAS